MLNKDLSRFMPSFGTFTNFKALFSVVSKDFPYLVHIISSFLEIDFEINISDKKSRRFDLSEVIFKCIKVL